MDLYIIQLSLRSCGASRQTLKANKPDKVAALALSRDCKGFRDQFRKEKCSYIPWSPGCSDGSGVRDISWLWGKEYRPLLNSVPDSGFSNVSIRTDSTFLPTTTKTCCHAWSRCLQNLRFRRNISGLQDLPHQNCLLISQSCSIFHFATLCIRIFSDISISSILKHRSCSHTAVHNHRLLAIPLCGTLRVLSPGPLDELHGGICSALLWATTS